MILECMLSIVFGAAPTNNPSQEVFWNSAQEAIQKMAPAIFNVNDYSVESQVYHTTSGFPADLQPACIFSGVAENCDQGYFPFLKISYKPNPLYFALIYLLPGKGDLDPTNKLMLVSDAFDPGTDIKTGNRRGLKDVASSSTMKSLVDFSTYSPRTLGYDMVFVDYSQGAGDIFINAGIFAKVAAVISQKYPRPILVGGPSMGGIVSQVGLLYLLPQNNSEKTDLSGNVFGFLSIDSPHQGAEINSWIQIGVYNAAKSGFTTWIAEQMDQKNSAIDSWHSLTTPAAWEMLYLHYDPSTGNALNSTVHDEFYRRITAIGSFHPGVKKAAIAYSNFFHPISNQAVYPRSDYGKIIPFLTQNTAHAYISKTDNFMDVQPGSSLEYFANYANKLPDVITKYAFPVCYDIYHGGTPAVEECPSNWWNTYFRPWSGTFIPISSALNLSFDGGNVLAAEKDLRLATGGFTDAELMARTNFNYIAYMKKKYSHYNGIEFPRYMHIVFEDDLMKEIQGGLVFLKTGRNQAQANINRSRGTGMIPILQLLLD